MTEDKGLSDFNYLLFCSRYVVTVTDLLSTPRSTPLVVLNASVHVDLEGSIGAAELVVATGRKGELVYLKSSGK
jgi:hypothetical protein